MHRKEEESGGGDDDGGGREEQVRQDKTRQDKNVGKKRHDLAGSRRQASGVKGRVGWKGGRCANK